MTTRFDAGGGAAGVAVGVSGSTPVQQALLALVAGGELLLVRRGGGTDHVLARAPLPAPDGAVELHLTAFDDRVRAQVGDVVLEAERGAVREGRVALVADGAARFRSLLVDGLELYRVPFRTSRYATFAEHVASREPTIAQHAPDGMGVAPARTPAQVLGAEGAAIAQAMAPTGDPQARQELFARVLSDVGLPSLERCDRLTLSRLVDAGGTSAILLESPEPISFVHDVAAALARRVWHRVPWWGDLPELSDAVHRLIPHVDLVDGQALAPHELTTALAADGSRLVHVAATDPPRLDVFDPISRRPQSGVAAERTATLDEAAARAAGLEALLDQPAGTVAAVRPDRSIAGAAIGGWQHGTLVHEDEPLAFTLLADGDETAALLIPPSPLGPGTYPLTLTLDRTRWTTATAHPQARYRDEAVVVLEW